MTPIAIFLITLHFFAVSSLKINVNPENSRFIDQHGRQIYFHGWNFVEKDFPWYPPATNKTDIPLNEYTFGLFQEWGMNMIRLGTMWEGIEPERGQYNSTYINALSNLIKLAGDRGIYTLADMHQDVYNRRVCGQGFPDWTAEAKEEILQFPLPLDWPFKMDPNGVPSKEDCRKHDWSSFYFTKATGNNYQNLYENVDNLADQMGNAWIEFSKVVKDQEYFIGYEMYNEPWAGDIYSKPWMAIPSMADRYNLQPFYDRVAAKVRSVDDQKIIFFAGITFDQIVPAGFDKVPGGDNYRNRSAFVYHYYNPPNFMPDSFWKVRDSDSKRLKTGVLLSEFSIFFTPEQTDSALDHCDKYMHSWTSWAISAILSQKLEPHYETIKHISRTYVQALGGHAIIQSFNATTAVYSLEFQIDTAITQPTQIYYNEKLHYPEGVAVSIVPEGKLQWKVGAHNKIFITGTSGAVNGEHFTVSIQPQSK